MRSEPTKFSPFQQGTQTSDPTQPHTLRDFLHTDYTLSFPRDQPPLFRPTSYPALAPAAPSSPFSLPPPYSAPQNKRDTWHSLSGAVYYLSLGTYQAHNWDLLPSPGLAQLSRDAFQGRGREGL